MYKVGTICVGQKFVDATQRNGMEGEIVKELFWKTGGFNSETGAPSEPAMRYMVKWADGAVHGVRPRNLRPKHYPGSWEDELFKEVLKELGWNPLKEKENVV